MPQKSLAACDEGKNKALLALNREGLSENELAGKLQISSSTVNNFFNLKPITTGNFRKICDFLKLDFDEIAGITQASRHVTEQSAPQNESSSETINIDELVQTARDKIGAYIEERCSTMRVLDMTQPIGLDDIYTSVNILETITGRKRVASIEELIENASREDVERFSLGEVCSKRVPGLEAVAKYSKLMILGKPGAGKTTFLKHLALLCIKGKFQENCIPLFITLKDFAEAPNQPDFFSYLIQIFIKSGIAINTDAGINSIEQLLKQGKLLVLLDGLDEVREADSARVLKLIQDFTTDYPVNQFVITCRIASREYTFHITERRWREVFLLTVGMLKSADSLLQLMKQEIDGLLAGDEKLQQFLTWVEEKSNSLEASYKPAAVRAWYFSIDFYLDRDLYLYLYLYLDLNLSFSLDQDLYRDLAFALGRNQELALDRNLALVLTFAFALARNITLDRNRDQDLGFALALYQNLYLDQDDELKPKLQQLKTKLPNPTENFDTFRRWWEENGANWIEQLRDIMTDYRNIDRDWQFTNSQLKLLNKYYSANEFLIVCLNSDCYVSRDVRKYIEDTLILPIKSIPPVR